MKFSTFISCGLLFCAGLFFASCGGDDGPGTPAEEKQLAKLTGTWELQSAVKGGIDDWADDEFAGLELTLSGTYEEGGTYSYALSITEWPINSPWPENGSWKFGGTTGTSLATQFIRLDDGQMMTYTVTDTQLTFTFTYNGDGFQEGKTTSVEGNWVFVFVK